MIIIYDSNGMIHNIVYDKDKFPSVIGNLNVLEIDEIEPENGSLCKDLVRTYGKIDDNGNPKYYVDEDGDLFEVDDWEPYEDIR